MHAVVRIAGKQFAVRPEQRLRVPRLQAEVGAEVAFDEVLLVGGPPVRAGAPVVDGARVTARVLRHARDTKIVVFKKKKRRDYRRRNGHRQPYSEIRIEAIETP